MILLYIFGVICGGLTLYAILNPIKKKEPKKHYQSRYQKFKLPSQFWDDYNQINFFISDMGIDECERVRYLIDDFTYKYAQIMDYKVYIDTISVLLQNYYSKEKYLLQFKIK